MLLAVWHDLSDVQAPRRSTLIDLAAGSVTGTALISADGLWSNVRKQVVGDGPPRVSGHTTYLSVIPTEQTPEDLRWNAATLWAGPKCHIVHPHCPLSSLRWKVFNLVVTYHNDAPEPVVGKAFSDEEVLKDFRHVATIMSIAPKIGCTAQTLYEWVKKREREKRRRDGRYGGPAEGIGAGEPGAAAGERDPT